MSLNVNLIFDPENNTFSHVEDAKTGEKVDVGRWVQLEDGIVALQLRIVHTRNGELCGDDTCPTCMRTLPRRHQGNREPSKP